MKLVTTLLWVFGSRNKLERWNRGTIVFPIEKDLSSICILLRNVISLECQETASRLTQYTILFLSKTIPSHSITHGEKCLQFLTLLQFHNELLAVVHFSNATVLLSCRMRTLPCMIMQCANQ